MKWIAFYFTSRKILLHLEKNEQIFRILQSNICTSSIESLYLKWKLWYATCDMFPATSYSAEDSMFTDISYSAEDGMFTAISYSATDGMLTAISYIATDDMRT